MNFRQKYSVAAASAASLFLYGGVLNITLDPFANGSLPMFAVPAPLNATFLHPLTLLNAGSVNITLSASSILSLSDNVIQVRFSNDEYALLVTQVFNDDVFTDITMLYGANATPGPRMAYYCLACAISRCRCFLSCVHFISRNASPNYIIIQSCYDFHAMMMMMITS